MKTILSASFFLILITLPLVTCNKLQKNDKTDTTEEFMNGSITAGYLTAIGDDQYPATPRAQGILIIAGGTVLKSDGSLVRNATISVKDDRIQSVIAGGPIDSSAVRIIQADGKYVIPGLIDAHVHLIQPDLPTYINWPALLFLGVYKNKYYPAVRRSMIRNGITTVRSVGDPLNLISDLKSKIDTYELEGPRIYYAGPMLTATGGHPYEIYSRHSPEDIPTAITAVDTTAQAEAEVDRLHALGIEFIKIIYDSQPHMKIEVMQAIIQKAHVYFPKLRVFAHIESYQDALEAIAAGIDGLEHLPRDSGDAAALAKSAGDHGIFITPTLAVVKEKLPSLLDMYKSELAAIRADNRIVIAAGTDYPNSAVTDGIFNELELMALSGLSNLEALNAATVNAASLLDRSGDIGDIAAGKIADIVILNCNPLDDITCLRTGAKIVIQSGRVIYE